MSIDGGNGFQVLEIDVAGPQVAISEEAYEWSDDGIVARRFCELRTALFPRAQTALASVRLALRRLARAEAVNSTNHRLAIHDDDGRQIGS
jgi:hypothetical protein